MKAITFDPWGLALLGCWILSGVVSPGKFGSAGDGVAILSVVTPVFNEQDWIERSMQALIEALHVAGWSAEILVVDDGSTDQTCEKLEVLSERFPEIRVIRQRNRGRFEARRAGIHAAKGDHVLMVDSRVLVDAPSLGFVRKQLVEHPERTVWNGHVTVSESGGLYGAFWSGLVAVAWRRYLAAPKLTSFGEDDFDLYPKGTGFFLAPRDLLTEALNSFSSLYEDARLSSDDTRLLRWIAARRRINLSPEFSATYISRDSLKKYVKHAFFRGTTFVDGYLDAPGPARRYAGAAALLGILGASIVSTRPRAAVATAIAVQGSAALAVRRSGGSSGEARAVGILLPLFVLCFGSGVVRGLSLAVRKRIRG
jgi:glycosyltransferase involved in cell wall biosynthesis